MTKNDIHVRVNECTGGAPGFFAALYNNGIYIAEGDHAPTRKGAARKLRKMVAARCKAYLLAIDGAIEAAQ